MVETRRLGRPESETMERRILKSIWNDGLEEVDIDNIYLKFWYSKQQIYHALMDLHKRGIIEKRMEITPHTFPLKKKLFVKISKRGLWMLRKKAQEKKNALQKH